MKLSRTNIVLAVALVVVILLSGFLRVDHSRPNYEIYMGDDMTYSPAYDSFAPNQVFADGRTSQPPVIGTIARGAMPLYYNATPEDAQRAGEELTSPYDLASEEYLAAVERGRQTYQVFCVACHGSGGAGDGPVAKRGFPPPPSLLTGKSVQMKDGQLFHILTYGQGSMSPFVAQLTRDRRWDAIAYVRSIQQSAAEEVAAADGAAIEDSTTPDESNAASTIGEPTDEGANTTTKAGGEAPAVAEPTPPGKQES